MTMSKSNKALSTIRLNQGQIASYQKIYLETFGKHISKDDALVQGLALVQLVKVISQVDDYEKEYENDYRVAKLAN